MLFRSELRKQQADLERQQLENTKKIQYQQQILNDSIAKLQEENANLEKIDPNRFWNNKSTFGKIMAFIGMALGGPQTVAAVQKMIDNDIETQKLNNQQKLARRQHALKLVQNQIDQMQRKTNNEFKRQQLKLTSDKLEIEKKKINNERVAKQQELFRKQLLARKMAGKEGFTKEEIADMAVSHPKLKIHELYPILYSMSM